MSRRYHPPGAGTAPARRAGAALWLAVLLLVPAAPRAQSLLDAADHPKFVNALPIPTRIDAHRGNKNFVVDMRETTQWLGLVDALGDPLMTTVWGYGLAGEAVTYPGPTFEAKSRVPVRITWRNMLPTTYSGFPGPGSHLLPVDPTIHVARPAGGGIPTVVHLHGGNTESASDGLPDAWYTQGYSDVGPGFVKQQHFYQNTQEAATLWYHDHAQGITRLNVYAGLAGFYLLRDPNEERLIRTNTLPGGPYEIEIAIQDRMFTSDGQLFVPHEDPEVEEGFDPLPENTPSIIAEFFGDFILVNGVAWPKLEVEPRRYRFRLLNGSDSRFYVLELRDGATGGQAQTFFQIGTDQGFLNNPVPLTQLLIGPGERADVVVDFAGLMGSELYLRNFGPDEPFRGFEADGEVIGGPADEETSGQIMRFVVNRPLSRVPNATLTASTSLRRQPVGGLGPEVRTRSLALFEGLDSYGRLMPMLGIVDPASELDGSLTFSDPITENPMLGDVEVWEIYNATMDAHPIHLHLVAFQVLGRQAFHAELEVKEQHLHGTNGEMAPAIGWRLTDIETYGPVRPPDPNEAGWKDTAIMLPHEVTRIIARFDRAGRYVWHCHILSHEDHDMMRPYYVGPIPAAPPALAATVEGALTLAQNRPNPFNLSTVIAFELPATQHIRLAVFDLLGRQVALVADGTYPEGEHHVVLEAPGLASGMYIYRLETENGVFTRTMTLAK